MSAYAKVYKNHHYIFTVIDIFSKYAWAVATETKSGSIVTVAMHSVFEQRRQPCRLHIDKNRNLTTNLMYEYDVHMYSTFSNLKSCFAEIFVRSLQTLVSRGSLFAAFTSGFTFLL